MPLQAPNLDDRTFDDLVAEAIRRIPRFAPEWTDHNSTDPGITFLELYAWLTELTLFRLNQVPDRLYVKFLELLGIQLSPARPARVDLSFDVARDDVDVVIVPRGTQVAAPAEDGGDPVIFELDEALVALGAKLAAVQSFDGFGYQLDTRANENDGQTFAPFGSHAREGSALVLGFDSPLEMTEQQVRLDVWLEQPSDRPRGGRLIHACEHEAAPSVPPAELEWEFWDGDGWRFLSLERDGTRALAKSGAIVLRGPGNRAKKATLGAATEQPLYWLRGRLARSGYDRAPRIAAIALNTMAATEGQTVTDEVLGGSDGRPGQSFRLANAPLLAHDRPQEVSPRQESGPSVASSPKVLVTSLRLEVNEGGSEDDFEVWQEVGDFAASGPDDPHYVLDRTLGEVRFGDGRQGRIPLANPDFPVNLVARHYRFGGGQRGNIGAGAALDLQSYVEGIAGVRNPRPALGGSDEETVEEARGRAAGDLKSRGRAVTGEDFEHLALATSGVRIRRAKALPRTHPSFVGADVPGVVTVVVVPDAEGPRPSPSEQTLENVCRHLDRHRLLTTEVHVAAPVYHEIVVEADIVARGDADLAEVKAGVESTLLRTFHPLEGGEDGAGWPFGGDVFYSRVYRELLDVEGVDRVRDNQLVLWLDGERQPFCRDVCLESGALLFSGEHRIRISYDFGDGS